MKTSDFQGATEVFAAYPRKIIVRKSRASLNWLYPVMLLTEEAGEVEGKFAKALRDDGGIITEERKKEIKKELGDVLWAVSQICNELSFAIEDIMEKNIEKLKDRRARGVISGSGDNR